MKKQDKRIISKIETGTSFCFEHHSTKYGRKVKLHHICFLYNVQCDFTQAIKTCPDGLDSNGAIWLHKDDCDLDLLTPLARLAVNVLWEL